MRGIIVVKKKNLLVPEGYLTKVLKECPHGLGMATVLKTGITIERNEGEFSSEDWSKFLQDYADFESVLWFMDATTYPQEDVQPFLVMGKDEENADIVGFADGSFPNFIPSASNHSNEYFLFNKYIAAKIKTLGSDFDAVMNNLGSDLVKMELQGICGDRGTIVLIARNGRMETFEKNSFRREYEWGWVSNHLDYVEKPIDTTTTKPGITSKIAAGVKRALPIIASTEPVKQAAPMEPVKTETVVPQEQLIEEIVEAPQDVRKGSFKGVKQYYRGKLGYLPSNWKEYPRIKVTRKALVTSVVVPTEDKPKIIKDLKDLGKYATYVVAGELPLMGPKLIEALQADKDLDKNSNAVPDPQKISQDMEHNPSFWEEAPDFPQNVTDAWSWEQFKTLGTKYPIACAKLAWSYRNAIVMGEEPAEEQVTTEVLSDKVDTSGTGIVKKDTPAIVETPAPVQTVRLKRRM